MRSLRTLLLVVVVAAPVGCASRGDIPVVIGQASVALAESVGELQRTTKELTDAGVLPVDMSKSVQERLLQTNDKIEQAIPYLETLDKAVRAGEEADPNVIDQALAVLTAVSSDLAVVLTGVPLNETTQAIVEVVRAAQQAVSNTLVEVARLKGA